MRLLFFIFLVFTNVLFAQNEVAFVNLAPMKSKSKIKNTKASLTYVPFDLVDRKIIVQAKINNTFGNFMLDTGAPGITLNEKVTSPNQSGKGINGALRIGTTFISLFEWAGIRKGKSEVSLMDLTVLEEGAQKQLLGLIGYDILKNKEVLFDYKNQMLVLSNSKKSTWHKTTAPKFVLPFKMVGHLPVVELEINNKKVNLALDSGSESNLLDLSIANKIPKKFITKAKREILVGLEGKEVNAPAIWLNEVKTKHNTLEEMKYLCADLQHLSEDLDIDGLLGFPFFQSKKFSINYKEQKIYIWE